jgi:hypothetical protein
MFKGKQQQEQEIVLRNKIEITSCSSSSCTSTHSLSSKHKYYNSLKKKNKQEKLLSEQPLKLKREKDFHNHLYPHHPAFVVIIPPSRVKSNQLEKEEKAKV